jgi:hypothetical protein
VEKVALEFWWTETCQYAFESLISKLSTPPVLTFPDFTLPFVLHTDASGVGLGAVLYQLQNGKKRVLAYGSRSLTHSEQRYCTYRLVDLRTYRLVDLSPCRPTILR